MGRSWILLPLLMLCGCLGVPRGIRPVEDFELDRYLGTWYEVARLDHRFERGLTRVTAEYTLKADGTVRVVNRGYSAEKNAWKEAEGRAAFVGSTETGYLKVSFFGPFYGSYVIFELDREAYSYAFVTGPDRKYLWLLARTPDPGPEVVDRFVTRSKELGFDTDALIFVDHGDTEKKK